MRVRVFVAKLLVLAMCATSGMMAQESDRSPSLLLTPKLLRRLQRDRQRQTIRWINLEKRVQGAPDSPERGFELALYHAVTQDRERGRQAVQWAQAHKAETRQLALILDWANDVMTPGEQQDLRAALAAATPDIKASTGLRDALFQSVLGDKSDPAQFDAGNAKLLANLKKDALIDPAALYAACEYLLVFRAFTRADVRDLDPRFFNLLPKELLLSLKPEQIDRPPWLAHAAALALVTLDPNLENSQYLQGWAMEDRQTLQDGPGVAYELLWADPYLPGIAYQNMDPWTYDNAGTLFARANWARDACWLHVSSSGEDSESCAAEMAIQPAHFGTLTLAAMTTGCSLVPARGMHDAYLLWKLRPAARLVYESGRQKILSTADPSGLWAVPNEISGKICYAPPETRR